VRRLLAAVAASAALALTLVAPAPSSAAVRGGITAPAPTGGDVEPAPAVRLGVHVDNLMPVGRVPGWGPLIFTDSFSADVPLGQAEQRMTRWVSYDEGWSDSDGAGNPGNGTYSTRRTVSVANGLLNIHLHTEAGKHLVATMYPKRLAAVTYGRFAIRWRADDDLQQYLLIPTLVWPGKASAGEVDHPEMTLANNGGRSFIHYRDKHPIGAEPFRYFLDPTVWHTTIVEWSPGLVVLITDGVETGRSRPGAFVANTPARILMPQATTLVGQPAPADATEGNVQVDWVAAWSYGG
jgi:hypothetical protein